MGQVNIETGGWNGGLSRVHRRASPASVNNCGPIARTVNSHFKVSRLARYTGLMWMACGSCGGTEHGPTGSFWTSGATPRPTERWPKPWEQPPMPWASPHWGCHGGSGSPLLQARHERQCPLSTHSGYRHPSQGRGCSWVPACAGMT